MTRPADLKAPAGRCSLTNKSGVHPLMIVPVRVCRSTGTVELTGQTDYLHFGVSLLRFASFDSQYQGPARRPVDSLICF